MSASAMQGGHKKLQLCIC